MNERMDEWIWERINKKTDLDKNEWMTACLSWISNIFENLLMDIKKFKTKNVGLQSAPPAKPTPPFYLINNVTING